MSTHRMTRHLSVLLAVGTILLLVGVSSAQAAPPVKLTLASQFGREVNLTQVALKGGPALENLCTVASRDECKAGTESSEAGGFDLADSVAAAPSKDIYVADAINRRIQEFNATGQFVLMFGKEVNETGKSDICTAAEVSKCKAGVEGGAAGQFDFPYSIAIDPASGDIYVAEVVYGGAGFGERVQKFTAEGNFIFEIGKEVNGNTRGNLCTHVEEGEGVKCTGPAMHASGSFTPEDGSFNFEEGLGNLLAVGAGGKLYVGDEGRVQEFMENGQFSEEIALEAGTRVDALALDGAGNLYLTNHVPPSSGNIVRKFDATGAELPSFEVSPEVPEAEVGILGLAVDEAGHLAVTAYQSGTPFGSLYEASTGVRLSAFRLPPEGRDKGIAFNGSGQLYVATEGAQEILQYTPKTVAELVVSAGSCSPSGSVSVTFDCTLAGEVNPEGVAETEAFFEWGTTTALGEATAAQQIAAPEAVHAVLSGLRPNETFYYRLAGHDENVKAPEGLQSERASLATPVVAPRILGTPSVSYVTASSAVLSDEVNPENTATTYEFQYAKACIPGESCPPIAQAPGMVQTASVQSAVYGATGATQEIVGLQPGTSYRYQLAAVNEKGQTAVAENGGALPEGTFTTAAAPAPQASSGSASGVGTTTAMISGSVNSDGLPATYSFELGVYEGAATQYGAVFSGPAGAGSTPVEEALALSGLQPGLTYAFRIAVHSGYIPGEGTLRGAPVLFTTGGVASLLASPASLPMLATPSVAFPTEPGKATTTTTTKGLTIAQRLAKALKQCKKDRSRSKRKGCEKVAHKRYKPAKKTKEGGKAKR
jgi:hypothetical protein